MLLGLLAYQKYNIASWHLVCYIIQLGLLWLIKGCPCITTKHGVRRSHWKEICGWRLRRVGWIKVYPNVLRFIHEVVIMSITIIRPAATITSSRNGDHMTPQAYRVLCTESPPEQVLKLIYSHMGVVTIMSLRSNSLTIPRWFDRFRYVINTYQTSSYYSGCLVNYGTYQNGRYVAYGGRSLAISYQFSPK